MRYHATGKVSFDDVYVQADPRAYFSVLSELGYCIPQLAKPRFAELIREHREWSGRASTTVVDIGSSYGVNAALLRCDLSFGQLASRYADGVADRAVLLARDRDLVRSRPCRTRFVGLDQSLPALSYATLAGFLDGAIHGDLEADQLTGPQRDQLADTDLVISTGCLGYVTGRTLGQVLEASTGPQPWMAHFVLRMFPYDEIATDLAERGYETVASDGLYKQRRFASEEEQAQVLGRLSEHGVDPSGLEADGWMYARLFVSRPRRQRRSE